MRCYLISDVRCICACERYVLTFECLSCGHFLTTSDNLNRPHKFWCVFMFDPGRSQLPAWCRQLFSENLWTRRSKRSLSTWYGPPVIPDRDVKAYVDLVLSDPNSHLFSLIVFTAFFSSCLAPWLNKIRWPTWNGARKKLNHKSQAVASSNECINTCCAHSNALPINDG